MVYPVTVRPVGGLSNIFEATRFVDHNDQEVLTSMAASTLLGSIDGFPDCGTAEGK